MLSNLLDLVSRRGRTDYPQGFIRSVRSPRDEERDRRFARLLRLFWVVIAVKCGALWWVMRHYRVPIHPLWVVAPTLLFAGLCTAVWVWRD